MVSSSLLLGLTTVAGLVHGHPLRSADDLTHSSSNLLTSRSPEPRFKNPFDVADFLKKLDTKIPDNQDIQKWIDQAEQKGAMGEDDDDDSDDDDDDDNDDKDIDDDNDDDDDHDHRKEGHPDHPKIGKMTKPSPSAPSPKPTVAETSHAVASSIPSPSSNVKGQVTTVYVPVPVFRSPVPSLDRDETFASTPSVFASPSTTPLSATPTSTPIMYKVITA